MISDSPTGAAFGSMIGLLIFLSLVARLLVFITAWTATARDTPPLLIPPPNPATIQITEQRRSSTLAPAAVGAAIGALATTVVGHLRRPRR